MKEDNMTGLGELLRQMPDARLEEMFQSELKREPPDQNAVRLLMQILREREAASPTVCGRSAEAAMERYREKARSMRAVPVKRRRWIPITAIAAVLTLVILLLVPQQAAAKGIFGRLTTWTDYIFELFSPGEKPEPEQEYTFRTDHPGLQTVYDQVVELGVTVPVVPSWIWDECELDECKVITSQSKTRVYATFLYNDSEIVYYADICNMDVSVMLNKDSFKVSKYETNGITHNIMRNDMLWVVVWTQENIECSIFIDCQEEDLYRILDSIYVMEDYE